MYIQVEKMKRNKSKAVASSFLQKKGKRKQKTRFTDERSEAITQRKLQGIIDNHLTQGVEVIQPEYYKTEKSKNKRGMQGAVNVETNSTDITLAGRLIGSEGGAVKASGTVYTPEYKVSKNRKIAAKRIRETKVGSVTNYFNPSDALRVQNLTANPRGMNLGHLLTYHHALEAQRRGKPYVIAQSVSDARGPFYTPLGFIDYDPSKPWKELDSEEKILTIVVRNGFISDDELAPILARIQELKEEKANSDMIIKTSDLIANSKVFYEKSWEAE